MINVFLDVVVRVITPLTPSPQPPAPASASLPTIVVMDPDADARNIARLALESAGYRVVLAEDGAECIAMSKRVRPDLIIAEIFSPYLDGFEVLSALRSEPDTAGIPVVALTTWSPESDDAQASSEGFVEFITKPVEPRRLIDMIRTVLARSKKPA